MGSFSEAFKMGSDMYDSSVQAKRQKVLDERATTEFEQRQQEVARNKSMQQEEDAARASYRSLQGGVYDGSQANFNQPQQDVVGGGPVQKSEMVLPSYGLKPRTATDREMNAAAGKVASAKGDMVAAEGSREKDRGYAWDDGFKQNIAAYKGTPEQLAEAAKHINIKSGSITMSAPDASGVVRMSVAKPDGTAEFIKLSPQEQAQVYAGVQMMNVDPERAITAIGKVNASLGTALAAESDMHFKVGKENREATLGAAHAKYYNSAGEAMVTKADAAAEKAGGAVDRMSEIDKATLANINKDRQTINSAITKGIADGGMDEKSPQLATLKRSLAALDIKEQAMYGKYEGAKPGADDALGIRRPAAKPSSPGGLQAASDAARNDTGSQRDILMAELKKANERLSVPGLGAEDVLRAQTDVDALNKTLARVPGGAGGVAPRAAPPAPAVGITPTTPVAKPVARPTPPGAPTGPPLVSQTAGDMQLERAARAAGYNSSIGNNGQIYFSRVVNGQGENLTGEQVAKRLNLIY